MITTTEIDVPRPGIEYPRCKRCVRGRVVCVKNLPVDGDDSHLPASFNGKTWLFTGEYCFDCEELAQGTFAEIVVEIKAPCPIKYPPVKHPQRKASRRRGRRGKGKRK